MLPLLLSNKPRFYGSLAASFLALVAAILIPRVTMEAIDNALIDQTTSLAPYIWALVGLALFRSILTYAYRTSLYGIAYRLEYDLRVIVFEHLTAHVVLVLRPRAVRPAHLTGQLRHPLGAAVPDVRAARRPQPRELRDRRSSSCSRSTSPSRSSRSRTIPFVYVAGVKMRNQTFPLSWIVQSRSADVATIVDENVNGVRVVKSFAAEPRPGRRAGRGRATAAVGIGADCARRGLATRRSWRTCRDSVSPPSCCTAGGSRSTAPSPSGRSLPSTPTS